MLNIITTEVHNLVLGMALNNRDIYRAQIINTEDDETRELLHRAFKMPRKRMAVRATFVK